MFHLVVVVVAPVQRFFLWSGQCCAKYYLSLRITMTNATSYVQYPVDYYVFAPLSGVVGAAATPTTS